MLKEVGDSGNLSSAMTPQVPRSSDQPRRIEHKIAIPLLCFIFVDFLKQWVHCCRETVQGTVVRTPKPVG